MPAVITPAARPLLGQRQERLKLEPTACLPRGYSLDTSAGGLQLVRDRDGARLGFMASLDIACDHAAALARMEAHRALREEAS